MQGSIASVGGGEGGMNVMSYERIKSQFHWQRVSKTKNRWSGIGRSTGKK